MTDLLESARTSPSTIALLAALALGASALTGCGGDNCAGCDPPSGPDPSSSGTCVAGDAPTSAPAIVPGIVYPNGVGFSELPEGGVIELQFGGQGGTHIDIGARAFVDAGPDAIMEIEVQGADWGDSTLIAVESCDGEWAQMMGRIFDPPSGDVTLTITIVDAGGTEIASYEMPAYVDGT